MLLSYELQAASISTLPFSLLLFLQTSDTLPSPVSPLINFTSHLTEKMEVVSASSKSQRLSTHLCADTQLQVWLLAPSQLSKANPSTRTPGSLLFRGLKMIVPAGFPLIFDH